MDQAYATVILICKHVAFVQDQPSDIWRKALISWPKEYGPVMKVKLDRSPLVVITGAEDCVSIQAQLGTLMCESLMSCHGSLKMPSSCSLKVLQAARDGSQSCLSAAMAACAASC